MFGLTGRGFSGRQNNGRKAHFKPRCEALESRELMSVTTVAVPITLTNQVASVSNNWWAQPTASGVALINSLPDASVRGEALADYQRDGYISRNDMMDIFNLGTARYTSAQSPAFSSLNTLVSNGATVGMPGYVQNLASKTLANAHGLLLGELKAMQSDDVGQAAYNYFVLHEYKTLAQDIQMEVGDWFLGQDHPDDSYVNGKGQTVIAQYQPTNLPLWNGSPTYQDVAQGDVGDCWLMASLAEVAVRNPADITNMFITNGDGTYTVRFYNNGTPDYVTVDNMLPENSVNTGTVFDHPMGNMWAALAEKAYAQENANGWIGSSDQGVASYAALSGGYPQWALPAITGLSAPSYSVNASSIMTAYFQGSFVVLCTGGSPNSTLVVPDHCYALLSYNGSSPSFTLFNPWGIGGGIANGNHYPGTIIVSCGALPGNFDSWAMAGAVSAPAPAAIIFISGPVQNAGDRNVLFVLMDNHEQRGALDANVDASANSAMLSSLARIKHSGAAADVFSSPDLFGGAWLQSPAIAL